VTPPDSDVAYVAAQVSMLRGQDDSLQFSAAKELSMLSSDVPATGISAGVLGSQCNPLLAISPGS